MSIETISKEVKRIRKKYAEKDPYALCRAMKISLIFKSMGTACESCKGFYFFSV